MAKNANILEKEAIELETKLKKAAVKEDGSRDDELLKFLYDNYHKRFLQDNKQIWDNGKLMIPFSLSAFGFYATLKCPNLESVIVLALASIALAFVWLSNAENHRAFQNKSFVWMRAIEIILLGPDVKTPFKIPDDWFNKQLSRPAAVNMTIRGFFFAVLIGWLLIIYYNI